jgi:hypothetical protein
LQCVDARFFLRVLMIVLDNSTTRRYILRRCARRIETSQLRWSGNARQNRLRCVARLRKGIRRNSPTQDARIRGQEDATVLEQEDVKRDGPRRCASIFTGTNVKQLSEREVGLLRNEDVQTSSASRR